MKTFQAQASYKPTKADLKFQRQEQRASNSPRRDCFRPQSGPGVVCTVMNLNESQETYKPKHRKAYQESPEKIFETAISKIPAECNATLLEPGIQNCTQNKAYAFNYSLETQPSSLHKRALFKDYELSLDLKNCQNSVGQTPNNNQLLECSTGLLNQAAAQSAKSLIPPPSMPLWGALLLGGSCFLAIAACCYCCVRKDQPTAEQRQRSAEQRQALLLAPQPDEQQLARAVPSPEIGQAPRLL